MGVVVNEVRNIVTVVESDAERLVITGQGGGGGSTDLSNYYTISEVDTLLFSKEATGVAQGLLNNLFKSGIVTAGSFSGSPKKYTVTFSNAYPNTNYSISICGVDSRAWSYETKATTGFVINTNAATALTGEVSWATKAIGEA